MHLLGPFAAGTRGLHRVSTYQSTIQLIRQSQWNGFLAKCLKMQLRTSKQLCLSFSPITRDRLIFFLTYSEPLNMHDTYKVWRLVNPLNVPFSRVWILLSYKDLQKEEKTQRMKPLHKLQAVDTSDKGWKNYRAQCN